MTQQQPACNYDLASRWCETQEHDLVRLSQSGDRSAFEELTRRNSDLCFRVAACILRSREDALDEVQNALWLAYSRIELFTFQAKFSSWLVRIVINSCYMRLRTIQRSPVMLHKGAHDENGKGAREGVTHDTPERRLAREQTLFVLRRELGSIPPLLRTPLEMHYMRSMPVKDIAEELGLTVAATKSRLHRGHLYLKERMLRYVTRRGPSSLTAA